MIFTAENTLLIGSILLFVSIVVGKTGYRFGVPTLLLFLVVGMLFGSDGLGLQFHDAKDAQFIGMVALSIILFSGGMDTKFREIKPILGPGIVLSTVGVLLTALFTGLFIWWLSGMSWTNIYLPITTSLLLASTMSSTDSASVFAIDVYKRQTLTTAIREETPEVVLLDMNFTSGINTGNEGLFWLHEIKKVRRELPVVLFTAYADIDLAIRGIKEGASDFIVKPWNNQKLVETLQAAASSAQQGRKTGNKKEPVNTPALYWGESKSMQQLRTLIEKVASTDANILITGENGTGKEMLAREIHALSNRRQQEMIAVDMGAITESLFESELFGHVKGSFTDAHTDRTGKFEAADHSTLFLDEIGNLPYHLQAKLLTAIQRRSIVRVGSNTPIPIDIRLICATNRNLQEMVDREEFREDLLYRINTIHIEIPPLRERKEDIVPLAERFIIRFCKQYDKEPMKFSPAAKEKLTAHPWYGNIRELEHAIEKVVIINDGLQIPAELFQLSSRKTETSEKNISTLEEMEVQMIRKALDACAGNLSAVAAQLGITRQTLYNLSLIHI